MSPKTSNLGTMLGCSGTGLLGSMVRINGLFHLLINGVYWGYSHLDVPLLGLLGWIHGGRIISAEDSPTYTKWGRYYLG